MMKLYRQHVLKEQPGAELIHIAPPAKPLPVSKDVEEREEVGSFGD